MNKLLYITGGNNEEGLSSAFKKFVPQYHEIVYRDLIMNYDIYGFNERLIPMIKEINPDVIFIQGNDIGYITVGSIKKIHHEIKPNLFLCWSSEGHEPIPKWYDDILPYVICCFASENNVIEVQGRGYPSYHFNLFDEDVYNPMESGKLKDIVFAGDNYTKFPMSKFRLNMVNFLEDTYGEKFHVFGNGWVRGKFASRREMNVNYNQAKIGIDCSNIELSRYTSGRPMHIMASGCLCLMKHYPNDEMDFTDGVHVRFWDTYEQLQELIDYYLVHVQEREEIAAAGNLWVREKFGYKNLEKVINEIY